eukprot:Skav236432  [mRNA]  locus=scaffold1156:274786:281348:- [translate_table: standard]
MKDWIRKVQWLTGMTSNHFDVRPQPSTDKFMACVHGNEECIIHGNAAACLPQLPYQIKEALNAPGSLVLMRHIKKKVGEVFKNTPAKVEVAEVAVWVALLLNRLTWTRPAFEMLGKMKKGKKLDPSKMTLTKDADHLKPELDALLLGIDAKASSLKSVLSTFSDENLKSGTSFLAAIGCLGYARVHALGAIAKKEMLDSS